MNEPRGHAAMSGAILQAPTRPDADWGVVYIEVSGRLPMCGHGTIGVAAVLVETGMVPVDRAGHHLSAWTPLRAWWSAGVAVTDGHAESVTIENVPSFTVRLDDSVDVPGYGHRAHTSPRVRRKLLRPRGTWDAVGLDYDRANQQEILAAGLAIMAAINASDPPRHPETREIDRLPPRPVHRPRLHRAGTPGTRWPSTPAGSTGRRAAPVPRADGRADSRGELPSARTSSTSRSSAADSPAG